MHNEHLLSLDPQPVWSFFRELTLIPRPSKKEEQVVAYLKKFAADRDLECIEDKVGNIIIKKPATEGNEGKAGIILQSHVDMVCQKNEATVFDFDQDPIETLEENGWVTANGTTLGADNGMGAAAMLAVLDDKTLVHGAIEALFTIDEETGMTGAFGLEEGLLDGKYLFNLDSEDAGELFIGCAGGSDVTATIPLEKEMISGTVINIAVTGLKGGHSGMEIDQGRGNAIKWLVRMLYNLKQTNSFYLAAIKGGSLRNAIPREAFATIVVDDAKVTALLQEFGATICQEYAEIEVNATINVAVGEVETVSVIKKGLSDKIIDGVHAVPNAVDTMNNQWGVVESSSNLASIKEVGEVLRLGFLVRGMSESPKNNLSSRIQACLTLAGFDIEVAGNYPGWAPVSGGALVDKAVAIHEKVLKVKPEIKIIHAGLECGIIGSKYPSLEMISFGPTIRLPHSPDEKIEIATVAPFWIYLKAMIQGV